MQNRPTLVVVSGPPATGKSTLARVLGTQLGCPTIIRDEIKQGVVMNSPDHRPDRDDPLNIPAWETFFNTITVLLKGGVTVVAEAAFQDRLWRPGLEPLLDLADIRVVRCAAPTSTIVDRITERARTDSHRVAHGDTALLADTEAGAYDPAQFVPISLDVPTLVVDTSDGYSPGTAEIEAFLLPRRPW
ncbi:ATP-binding protein [Streptomyces sp. NBC_00249]|uniref:AAA family ATPase n=1 Tax=Streptomyces sp. NBC_00249 TaxID=2975690 RepID=UPI00224E940E|nr:AAA family ATPase [Streptomyces sp. NBC_00249]MCX5195739.1 ATP-binding protein [Streptomyces sp. NBC_00249]